MDGIGITELETEKNVDDGEVIEAAEIGGELEEGQRWGGRTLSLCCIW